VKVYRATGSSDRTELVAQTTDWSNPPIHTFSTALDMSSKGFLADCAINNTGSSTVTFGPSLDSDEICMLWQYYYPAAGFHYASTQPA
jgi:hypothetical protein